MYSREVVYVEKHPRKTKIVSIVDQIGAALSYKLAIFRIVLFLVFVTIAATLSPHRAHTLVAEDF